MKARAQPDIAKLIQLFGEGRFADMEQAARAILKTHPTHGATWKALGVALCKQGKDAVDAMRRATQYLPNDPEAHFNLGVESLARQQIELAEASYRRTLALQPKHVHARNNLGNLLKNRGNIAEAEALYAEAIAIDPNYADPYYNLGLARQDSGKLMEAEQLYRQAIARRPDYALAYNNLGLVLSRLGRSAEAAAAYRTVLGMKPDFSDAWINLADLLRQSQAYVDAFEAARRAAALAPASAEARVALANVLCEIGDLAPGMAQFEQALVLNPDLLEAHDNLLFAENYVDGTAQPQATAARTERYGELVARRTEPYTAWSGSRDPERRLRIGFVSGDLYSHPVGYFIENVFGALAQHHATSLELVVYSNTGKEDELTRRLKQHVADWQDITHLPDAQLAQRIHADGIDILLDLSGHTAKNRLPAFAWKPAPVQATWLGYFATTGVAAIDYLIADPWCVPEGDAQVFSEAVWRLPETRLCFSPPDADVETGPLPALERGHVTFGCFNTLGKMGPPVVNLWATILRAVPHSTLFLKAKQLGQPAIAEQVKKRFEAQGIAASRLRLEGSSPRAAYLAAYREIDIALDPFPFTGGTTTAEALWMGVPVLTLAGNRMIARQGMSLLQNAGLPSWIAATPEAYLRMAVARAADLPALAALRAGLRAQVLASPIFDAARFAAHFETALRAMWRIDCAPP